MKYFGLFSFSLILITITSGYGYKILGIFPTMARSHYFVGAALMKGLAEKGHDVTMIAPFQLKSPPKNYREILAIDILESSKELMSNIFEMRTYSILKTFNMMFDMGVMLTNSTFNEKSVQQLIDSGETFDAVISEAFLNEAMMGFGHHFKAPVIAVSTFGASMWTCEMVGSPSPPSYVPSPFMGFTDQMSLVERIGNLAVAFIEKIIYEVFYIHRQEALYNSVFPDPKPPLRDLMKNVSLALLNTHFSLNYPRPYAINMIEVGGMHVNRKVNPLPSDIQKFLDSAKDGAIYFSLGSNLKKADLPKEKLHDLLKVFRSLKQKVLWKWEDKTLPGQSDNILINPWFPQDDILAHPNVKLFITHGGLLSTTEAVYHGVPIVGIPILGDQYLNMGRAEKANIGISLGYDDLNESSLKFALNEVLTNMKYTKNMKEMSARYRDQPMTPLDKAIYWTEYVARHKGAPHMHSAGLKLSFIQYHNLDAFAIIFGTLGIILYLIKMMISKICKSKWNKAKEEHKKNQ